MSTVKEVRDMANKTAVHGLIGKITKAWPPKSGGDGDGAWTRLDMELTDDTGAIRVKWWGIPLDYDINKVLNRRVRIDAGDKKPKATLQHGTFGNKPTREINVDASALQISTEAASPPAGAGRASGGAPAPAVNLPAAQYGRAMRYFAAIAAEALGQWADGPSIATMVNGAMISVQNGAVDVSGIEEAPADGAGDGGGGGEEGGEGQGGDWSQGLPE